MGSSLEIRLLEGIDLANDLSFFTNLTMILAQSWGCVKRKLDPGGRRVLSFRTKTIPESDTSDPRIRAPWPSSAIALAGLGARYVPGVGLG